MNTYVPLLTKHGQNKIQNEYESLKNKYLEITSDLRQKSSDTLDDAFSISVKKIEQLFLEDKMKKVQQVMDRMRIVKKARRKQYADVGSKVVYQQGDTQHTITLVDPIEVDPSVGFISIDSPLGKAISHQKVDSTIEVHAPRQTYQIKLLQIS